MMKKTEKTVLKVLIVLTVVFIWTNSFFSREQSSLQSGFVVNVLEFVFGHGNVSEHFIRKFAHFAEYFVLGMELMALSDRYFLSGAHGMFTAVVDETIQLISGRGSTLADVWLDFAGAMAGALVVLAYRLIKKKREIRQKP